MHPTISPQKPLCPPVWCKGIHGHRTINLSRCKFLFRAKIIICAYLILARELLVHAPNSRLSFTFLKNNSSLQRTHHQDKSSRQVAIIPCRLFLPSPLDTPNGRRGSQPFPAPTATFLHLAPRPHQIPRGELSLPQRSMAVKKTLMSGL